MNRLTTITLFPGSLSISSQPCLVEWFSAAGSIPCRQRDSCGSVSLTLQNREIRSPL
jgi:hypothetical protein